MTRKFIVALATTVSIFSGSAFAQTATNPTGGGSSSVTGGSCPAGQYTTAIDANGVPTCSTPGSTSVGRLSGQWYLAQGINPAGAATSNATSMRCAPGIARASYALQAIGTRVIVGFSGGHIALAVYVNDPTKNAPTGSPIVQSGGLATDTVQNIMAPVSGSLTAGVIYWFCTIADNATAQFPATGPQGAMSIIGTANLTYLPGAATAGFSGKTSSTITYTATLPAADTLTWSDLPASQVTFGFQQQ